MLCVCQNLNCIYALRDKYIDEIQTQRFSGLLQLLSTDWKLFPDPKLPDNRDQSRPQSLCRSDEEHISGASAEAPGTDAIKSASSELQEVLTAEDKKELCSGIADNEREQVQIAQLEVIFFIFIFLNGLFQAIK